MSKPSPEATPSPAPAAEPGSVPVSAPNPAPIPANAVPSPPAAPPVTTPVQQPRVSKMPQGSQPIPGSSPAATSAAAPTPSPAPPPRGSQPISGFSLKAALQADAPTASITPDAPTSAAAPAFSNEEIERRLTAVCATLPERFTHSRPRLATAFSRVAVTGPRIALTVPNANLREEVERCMLDLKREITALAGITCAIEFDITVEADTSFAKPVKADDKLRFLTDQNPHLTTLRKTLDLDIE